MGTKKRDKRDSAKGPQARTVKARAAFLEALRAGATITAAAKKAGVNRSGYYRWREDETFAALADQAHDEGTREAAQEALGLCREVIANRRQRIEVRLEAARAALTYAAKIRAQRRDVTNSGAASVDVTIRAAAEVAAEDQSLAERFSRVLAPSAAALAAQHESAQAGGNGGNGGKKGGNGDGKAG